MDERRARVFKSPSCLRCRRSARTGPVARPLQRRQRRERRPFRGQNTVDRPNIIVDGRRWRASERVGGLFAPVVSAAAIAGMGQGNLSAAAQYSRPGRVATRLDLALACPSGSACSTHVQGSIPPSDRMSATSRRCRCSIRRPQSAGDCRDHPFGSQFTASNGVGCPRRGPQFDADPHYVINSTTPNPHSTPDSWQVAASRRRSACDWGHRLRAATTDQR